MGTTSFATGIAIDANQSVYVTDFDGNLYSVDIASAVVILHVPNATADSTGLPTLPTRGSPWLTEAGTVMANIRIARR